MSCKLDRSLACGKGDVRMFSVGDQVCYPMHGVGVVEKIEERTVLGETAQYYVLRFISNKMTALVPVALSLIHI